MKFAKSSIFCLSIPVLSAALVLAPIQVDAAPPAGKGRIKCGDGVCRIRHGEDLFTCPADCQPICGNGVLEGSEQCDDDNTNSEDGCSSACVTEFCGDGLVQAGFGEECEGTGSESCTVNGYDGWQD